MPSNSKPSQRSFVQDVVRSKRRCVSDTFEIRDFETDDQSTSTKPTSSMNTKQSSEEAGGASPLHKKSRVIQHNGYATLQDASKNIRLLKILPYINEGPLPSTDLHRFWTLHEVPREAAPPYLAMSYVWGPETDRVSITVDRVQCRIPSSLLDALSALSRVLRDGDPNSSNRKVPRVSHVWADSISINQDDNTEKSMQVARMFDVYRGAVGTIAWLGDSSGDDNDVFASLSAAFGDRKWDQYSSGESWRDEDASCRGDFFTNVYSALIKHTTSLESSPSPDDARDLVDEPVTATFQTGVALHRLFGHSFWTRVWIIQETWAPKEIWYLNGTKTPSVLSYVFWKDILGLAIAEWEDNEASELLSALTGWGTWKSGDCLFRWDLLTQQTNKMLDLGAQGRGDGVFANSTLSELLRATRGNFSATDPRDLVYALLSISTDKPLDPDYSLTYPELCLQVALYLWRTKGIITALKEAYACPLSLSMTADKACGTWIADWRLFKRDQSSLGPVLITDPSPPLTVSVLGNAVYEGYQDPSLSQDSVPVPIIAVKSQNLAGEEAWYRFRPARDELHEALPSNSEIHPQLERDPASYCAGGLIMAVEDNLETDPRHKFILVRPDETGLYWHLHCLRSAKGQCDSYPDTVCTYEHWEAGLRIDCPRTPPPVANWQEIRLR